MENVSQSKALHIIPFDNLRSDGVSEIQHKLLIINYGCLQYYLNWITVCLVCNFLSDMLLLYQEGIRLLKGEQENPSFNEDVYDSRDGTGSIGDRLLVNCRLGYG